MNRSRIYFIFAMLLGAALSFVFLGYVPARASLMFGPPAPSLTISERVEYSTKLLAHGDKLITPLSLSGSAQPFNIGQGESVYSIASRLEQAGLIISSQAFYDYVVYSGLDLTIQAGEYSLSPAQSIVEIARTLQKFSPGDATLVILPGWRMEEIAESLPTSGLTLDPESFLNSAKHRPVELEFVPPSAGMEGFFFPDTYILPRDTALEQLLSVIARNFSQHLDEDLLTGFANQGLNVYQAVILASIVEREAIQHEEAPLIASVFLNRLNSGWTLGSDPTVQYALGFNAEQGTWWTNPLDAADLKIDSPFNTYVYAGLPPSPISNPGIEALRAVAHPESTSYFYFRAKCDNSGYHVFAVTLDEQIANGCE